MSNVSNREIVTEEGLIQQYRLRAIRWCGNAKGKVAVFGAYASYAGKFYTIELEVLPIESLLESAQSTPLQQFEHLQEFIREHCGLPKLLVLAGDLNPKVTGIAFIGGRGNAYEMLT